MLLFAMKMVLVQKKDSEKAMGWYKKLDNSLSESEEKEIGKSIYPSLRNFPKTTNYYINCCENRN